jgi:hypothetical protein
VRARSPFGYRLLTLEHKPSQTAGAYVNNPAAPAVRTRMRLGRPDGPVDLDKRCGAINGMNRPRPRSLQCKFHSLGQKRAAQGRSKAYDELLLEWRRDQGREEREMKTGPSDIYRV